jgi:hypothetical protein
MQIANKEEAWMLLTKFAPRLVGYIGYVSYPISLENFSRKITELARRDATELECLIDFENED